MTSSSDDDVRVVVGIDFGTTYSGFAFAHKSNPDIIVVQDYWKEHEGWFKAPTVIKYDDSFETVISWGLSALAKKPKKDSFQISSKPFELFKLRLLGSELEDRRPFLPDELDINKAKKIIKDYLNELGKDVKKRIEKHWRDLDFYSQVTVVLTVPAEFNDNAIEIMRECTINANLIKRENIRNLKFTTEPEAAAIHYMSSLKEGDPFMVVDCGGGTVDLTVRELDEDNELIEITERTGELCGSCYIDQAFVKFLGSKIGNSVIDLLRKNHYSNLQYIVQEFCLYAKIPFTGQEEAFGSFSLNLDDYKPIKQYIMERKEEEKEKLEKLEKDGWLIEVEFDDVKGMFDPVIEIILKLIREQLEQLERREKKCSTMLLAGGFSESEYLQDRIKKEFLETVPNISVPKIPVTSIMKGAVKFGLSERIAKSRVLKWTYGFCAVRKWQPTDPLSKKLPNGYIKVFEKLAERGKSVTLDYKVTKELKPFSLTQKKMKLDMYVTKSSDVKYIKDPTVKLLRKWEITLPKLDFDVDDVEDFEDIIISFTLKFGTVGMFASAENKNTGEESQCIFSYDL